MVGVASKVAVVMMVVLGLLVPLIHWADREQAAGAQGRTGPRAATFVGDPLRGLLQPLADWLKLLAKRDSIPQGARGGAYHAAPVLSVVAPVTALAVIPFAGRYGLGEHTLNLVVADLDGGVLWLLAAAWLGSLAAAAAGWSTRSPWPVLGGMRAIAQSLSTTIALGLSLVGLFMVYDSVRPSEIVIAQDMRLEAFAWLELLGQDDWATRLRFVQLPRWGIVVQPLAFVVFLVCGLAQCRRDPFDGPEARSELLGGTEASFAGARGGLLLIASHLRVISLAAVATALFFGGWSIPYLSQATIISAIAPFYGDGFATLVCIGLHVAVFWGKVAILSVFVLLLGSILPRLRYDQLMSLCWRGLLPLAFLNVFLTALALQWLEGRS